MITNKCPFCNRRVWFWNDKEFYEITPDWGLYAHKHCYTKKNHKKFVNNWFKESYDKLKERKSK